MAAARLISPGSGMEISDMKFRYQKQVISAALLLQAILPVPAAHYYQPGSTLALPCQLLYVSKWTMLPLMEHGIGESGTGITIQEEPIQALGPRCVLLPISINSSQSDFIVDILDTFTKIFSIVQNTEEPNACHSRL